MRAILTDKQLKTLMAVADYIASDPPAVEEATLSAGTVCALLNDLQIARQVIRDVMWCGRISDGGPMCCICCRVSYGESHESFCPIATALPSDESSN